MAFCEKCGLVRARCGYCGEVVDLDRSKVHVYPYSEPFRMVDFTKVKAGETVRGLLCPECKLSVDFNIVGLG